jgi:hypothetical protein
MLSFESLPILHDTLINSRVQSLLQFFVFPVNLLLPVHSIFLGFYQSSLVSFSCLFELAHCYYFDKHIAQIDKEKDIDYSKSQVPEVVLIIIARDQMCVQRDKAQVQAQHEFVPYVECIHRWIFKRLDLVYISYHQCLNYEGNIKFYTENAHMKGRRKNDPSQQEKDPV